MLDEVAEHLLEVEDTRHTTDEGEHYDPEGRLHLRVLEELVEDDLGDRIPLQLDDYPDPVPIRLIAECADLGDPLLPDEIGDLFYQPSLVDHEGDLGDDDLLPPTLEGLDLSPSAHDDPATACGVGVPDPVGPIDIGAGREVWAPDMAHQLLDRRIRVVDQVDTGLDYLTQVVRWEIRRQPVRGPAAALE